MCIIICETDHQSRYDAWDKVLRVGALGWPWGMGWGGRWEWGSRWETQVHPCLIHVNVWQNPLLLLLKSLQSCPTLCDPIDSSPAGSSVYGILQARKLEWVAISFSKAWKWKVKVKSLSRYLTLRDPMDCSLRGSSVHRISQARVLEWVAIAFSGKTHYNIVK